MKVVLLVLFTLLPIALSYSNTCPCQENQAFDLPSWQCKNYPQKGARGYIENCEAYKIEYDSFQCDQCQESYQLVQNYRTGEQKCQKTNMEGCIDIRGGSGFLDENRQQKQQTFLSYLSYGNESYKCYACDSKNYYLNTDTLKCVKNPGQDSQYYANNCANYQEVYRGNTRVPQCIECQPGYYLGNDSRSCKKNPVQDKCVKFGISSSAGKAVCTQCIEGYTVTQIYQCVQSDSIIENCQIANYGNSYKCSQCNTGYYLSDDRKTCIENPTDGEEYVENCRDYKIGSKGLYCIWCQNDYSLDIANDSQCVKVKPFNLVNHCNGYKSGGNYQDYCRGCETGFQPTSWNIRGCRQCPSPSTQL